MRYAVRNIGRLKTRSFLTFAMALIILFLSMFGIMVERLCADSRARFFGALDGSVYVTDDAMEPFLSYQAACAIDEHSDLITKVSARKEYDVYLLDIDYIGQGTFKRMRYPGEPVAGLEVDYIEGFRLQAVTSMDILGEVYSGSLTMVEGSMITEQNNENRDNKIVISDTLAQQQGLSIGDTVSVCMFSLYRDEAALVVGGYGEERYSYTYIIGGIYHNEEDNLNSVNRPWLVNANKVYVPITTVEDISRNSSIQLYYNNTNLSAIIDNPLLIPDSLNLHLSDMDAAEALEEELGQLGFLQEVRLTKYMSDASSSPSARLSQIIATVVVGVVAAGFVAFLLILFFNMNARRRELAMLSALGKRRSAIAGSFFLEVILLTALAAVLGTLAFAGAVSLFAAPITAYLNSAELSKNRESETVDSVLLGDPGGAHVLERMTDFDYLAREYILPSLLVTLAAALVLMAAVYLFVLLYVRRINALSAVGGKE